MWYMLWMYGFLPIVYSYDFLGCFPQGFGIVSFQRYSNPDNTTIGCMDTCANVHYSMVATFVDSGIGTFECFCGNDNQLTSQVDDADCQYPCPLSSADQCGGVALVAVYSIQGDTGPFSVIPNSAGTVNTTTEDYEFATSTETHDVITNPSNANSTETHDVITNPNNANSTDTHDVITNLTFANNCICSDANTVIKYSKDQSRITRNITQDLEEIRIILAIEVESTSKYRNTKRSARDDRPSSVAMGSVGIIVIFIPVILILLNDGMKLITGKTFEKRISEHPKRRQRVKHFIR